MAFNLNFLRRPLSPQLLRKKLLKREFQLEIASWIEKTLRPLSDQKRYQELCQQEPYFTASTKTIRNIFRHLHPYTTLGKPGHDTGHLLRDFLSGSAISGTDPYAAKAYPNDSTAAFFGAAYHDIGNSISFRFQDYFWECGHAEIGAWLFYHLTEKFLPENIRRLTAYAIASHTHLLKPVETKVGYTRPVWVDHLFETPDGHPVGISIWITRFADRLDTNGITLLCRHIIATIEGSRQEGRNFSGQDWYEINKNALDILLKPDTVIEGTTPSALKHLENFANSAKFVTPYSIHDKQFPIMNEFMTYKVHQSESLIKIVKTKTSQANFQKFRRFVAKMSLSPIITSTLNDVEKLWDDLSKEEQSHWGPAFEYIEKSYIEWLEILHARIKKGDSSLIKSVQPLVNKIIAQISLK
jgi:hypothetical protein